MSKIEKSPTLINLAEALGEAGVSLLEAEAVLTMLLDSPEGQQEMTNWLRQNPEPTQHDLLTKVLEITQPENYPH